MKLDPKMYPDHPETKMRYIEEELTKRVQYKEKGRSLKHTKTWDFFDLQKNIQWCLNLSFEDYLDRMSLRHVSEKLSKHLK